MLSQPTAYRTTQIRRRKETSYNCIYYARSKYNKAPFPVSSPYLIGHRPEDNFCAEKAHVITVTWLFAKMEASVKGFVFLILVCLFQSVNAFDGGDAVALVLGLIIGIIGIFACIGCYARKKAGQM